MGAVAARAAPAGADGIDRLGDGDRASAGAVAVWVAAAGAMLAGAVPQGGG